MPIFEKNFLVDSICSSFNLFVLYTKSTINMVPWKDAAQCVDEPSNLSHAIAQYT